jgi:hypothetical protein
MKACTFSATLDELLTHPSGLLVLRGAEGENDGAKPGGSSEEDGDKDGKSEGTDGEGDDADKDKDEKSKPESRELTNTKEALARNVDKRKEAEAEVTTLRAQIKQMEKDGTPDDAIKKQNDELVSTNTKLAADNTALRIQNTFLSDKSHDWVDPEAALRLVDMSDVEIDEKTGKVIGLKAALDKLAKDKKYLIKAVVDNDDKDDDKAPKGRATGKSPRAGTQKDADAAARTAKLRSQFPALRR